jgi:hypothetical protein
VDIAPFRERIERLAPGVEVLIPERLGRYNYW